MCGHSLQDLHRGRLHPESLEYRVVKRYAVLGGSPAAEQSVSLLLCVDIASEAFSLVYRVVKRCAVRSGSPAADLPVSLLPCVDIASEAVSHEYRVVKRRAVLGGPHTADLSVSLLRLWTCVLITCLVEVGARWFLDLMWCYPWRPRSGAIPRSIWCWDLLTPAGAPGGPPLAACGLPSAGTARFSVVSH
jgi:hypothetical protein